MWKNYLLTLLRQLLKYKSTYSITMAGLTFGLMCCLISYLHIRYEYSFDRFHQQEKQLFRLVTGDPSTSDSWVKMAPPISPKLKAELPEVEDYARLSGVSYSDKVMVEYRDQSFLESYFLMADPAYLNFFDYPMIKGDPATVLAKPENVIISESTATKLFGTTDPIGKMIRLKDSNLDFEVTGIFQDYPTNTHLRCNYLISFENLERIFGKGSRESWGQFNYFAYLKLHPDADPKIVQSKIQAITVRPPNRDEMTFDRFHLQPITDIHFEHNRGNLIPSYDVRYIYIFGTLAFTVLVICFMNYFNITAMLSMKRIKEIGVRKSVGASNPQVNRQFLLEGFILSVACLGLAIAIIELLKPLLSAWLESPILLNYQDPALILIVVGLCIFLTLVSGGYLTLYVNRLKPSSILKGTVTKGGSGSLFQHSLLFVQFSLSIVLVISSVVIVRQLRFLQQKDLGFDQEHIINVTLPREITPGTQTSMRSELLKSSLVESVGYSSFVPGRANWNQTVWWEGQVEPESMFILDIGKDFLPTMKIEMIEGTPEELQSATEVQYLINESALQHIGWANGKGKFISPFGEESKKAIVGVVKDFNYRSLHNQIAPLVLVVYPERSFSQMSVRLAGGNLAAGIQETERVFKATTNGLPFEFAFLDDTLQNLYRSELRMESITVVLTIISVCFALLGIYALLSFAIENRLKEIAIRKVLGISTWQLITLFTNNYFKIVVLASIVAVPLCWKLMNDWLSTFHEHIQPNALGFVFIIGGMILLVIGIGFSKYLSLKQINPSQSLKND